MVELLSEIMTVLAVTDATVNAQGEVWFKSVKTRVVYQITLHRDEFRIYVGGILQEAFDTREDVVNYFKKDHIKSQLKTQGL